jgi:hypothetical protein
VVDARFEAYLPHIGVADIKSKARITMGRYERGQFFETLSELRDGYATRSTDDQPGNLLLEDAIAYAEAVMLALETEAPEFDVQVIEPAAAGGGRLPGAEPALD